MSVSLATSFNGMNIAFYNDNLINYNGTFLQSNENIESVSKHSYIVVHRNTYSNETVKNNALLPPREGGTRPSQPAANRESRDQQHTLLCTDQVLLILRLADPILAECNEISTISIIK